MKRGIIFNKLFTTHCTIIVLIAMLFSVLSPVGQVFAATPAAGITQADGSILYGFISANRETVGNWAYSSDGATVSGCSRCYATGDTMTDAITAYFDLSAAGSYEVVLVAKHEGVGTYASVNGAEKVEVPALTAETLSLKTSAEGTAASESYYTASAGTFSLNAGSNSIKVSRRNWGNIRFDAVLLIPKSSQPEISPSPAESPAASPEESAPPAAVSPVIDEDFENQNAGQAYSGQDFVAGSDTTTNIIEENGGKFIRVSAPGSSEGVFDTKFLGGMTGENLVVSFRFRIYEEKTNGMQFVMYNREQKDGAEVIGQVKLFKNDVNASYGDSGSAWGKDIKVGPGAQVGTWYQLILKFNTVTAKYDVYFCDDQGNYIGKQTNLAFRGSNGVVNQKVLGSLKMINFYAGNVIDFDDVYIADDPGFVYPDAPSTESPGPVSPSPATPSGEYPPEWGEDYIVFDDNDDTFQMVYPEGLGNGQTGMSNLGSAHNWSDDTTAEGTFTLSDIPAGKYEAYVRIPVVHANNTSAQYFTVTDSVGNSAKTVLDVRAAQNFGGDNERYVREGESAAGIKSLEWNKLNGQFTFYKTIAGKAVTGIDSESLSADKTVFGNFRVDQIAFVKIEDVAAVPVALNVSIEGKNKPGATLTASYEFMDENDCTEQASTYKWYVKNTANAAWTEAASGTTTAAEGSTYTLKGNERFAKFEIIPASNNEDPSAATGSAASAEFAVTLEDAVPEALDVTVEGSPYLQAQLTGSYTYQDVNGDLEGESHYKWLMSTDPYADYSSWTVLEEGTCKAEPALTFNIPAAVPEGAYIRLAITPVNTESTLNTGTTVYSAPIGPVENVTLKPEVKNVGFDGQAVNAEGLEGLAIGGEAELSYTYTNLLGTPEDPAAAEIQWYRGDTQVGPWSVIEGAVGRTYTPVEADSGKYIRYSIIVKDTNGTAGDITYSSAYLVKWNLKFFDEFDYTVQRADQAPMTEKWVSDTNQRVLGTPVIEQARIPDNTSVSEGTLRILTKKEHNSNYNYSHTWTTGNVWTKDRVGPYGYYETSMKFAKATGLNESFWMAGGDGVKFIELDFCEGHYPYEIKSNLHYFDSAGNRIMASKPHYPLGQNGPETLGDNFNKLGGYLKPNDSRVAWNSEENSNTFQVFSNDKLERSTISLPTVPESGKIFLSIAVYPGFAGKLVDSEADGSVLEFDYVRYYEEIGVSQEGTIGTEIGTIELNSAIAEAEAVLANAVIGNETGNYSSEAKAELEKALREAKAVTTPADKAAAAAALNEAIQAFKDSRIGDPAELKRALTAGKELLNTTSAGTGFGQCPQSYYNNLERAIERSETLLKNAPTQAQLDSQLNLLQRAMDTAKAQIKLSGTVTNNGQVIDIAAVIQADGTVSVDAPVTNVKLKVPSVMPEGFELPIRYNGTNVVLNLPEGRTMTAGNYEVKWSRNNNSSTLYTIDFSNLTAVNGLISVTINKASGDKVLSNGAEITTKLSENSYEAAEALYTGGDFTAIYEGSTSVSIYTNKLGRYDVCNENTATPTPDNGNSNNNNNNNNNSGNWTPGVIVPPNSNTNKVKFTDIAGHWAENEIRELAKEGIINGRSETEFEPEDTMTRAEYAALIRRAIGLNPSIYSGGFNDVEGNAWYANEIQAIVNAGIMSGDADGSFRPNAPISREEMAKVIVNAYLAKSGAADVTAAEISFTDSGEIAPWAQEYIGKAATLGLINGMGDGSYAPKGNMTRAQGSVVIYRLIK